MHPRRIELVERIKKAEEELFAAIEAVEAIGPEKYSRVFDKEFAAIAEAMAAVYRRAIHIPDKHLTPDQ